MGPAARAALAGALAVLGAGAARAETLADALALAYATNPTLVAQRAQLQATDEGYVQALAALRPTLSAQAAVGYDRTPEPNGIGGSTQTRIDAGRAALSLSQPLYTGGRATAQVRAAEDQVRAAREALRQTEAQVLFDVVVAYCDVTRDRADLAIQRDGYATLRDATEEIRARHVAGANTATDVAQAEAQLAAAQAATANAQAQAAVSVAEYVSDVGQSPGALAAPSPLPALPADLDQAFDVAEREAAPIRQTQFSEAAARAQVQAARAAERPSLSLSGQFGYTGRIEPSIGRDYAQAVAVTATLTQPLFSGGLLSSQVRQATAQDSAARVQVEVARRSVIENVSQSWSQQRAAAANVAAEAAQVAAARAAFDGMRVEYRAGLRSTLDVLIAQETLTSAKLALEAARHDATVTQAQVLAAIGRLEARVLLPDAPLYRPETSLRRVARVGALPWDPIARTLDRIGAPADRKPERPTP